MGFKVFGFDKAWRVTVYHLLESSSNEMIAQIQSPEDDVYKDSFSDDRGNWKQESYPFYVPIPLVAYFRSLYEDPLKKAERDAVEKFIAHIFVCAYLMGSTDGGHRMAEGIVRKMHERRTPY